MGGSAFTSRGKPLFTPRMPKPVYERVKAQCHSILRDLYWCVASPIDGPGKKDFGDVDVLVAWPKTQNESMREQLEKIAEVLGATDAIVQGKDCSSNLAIPWASTVPDAGHATDDAVSEDSSQEKHIQVDVRVCENIQAMHWMLFKHAHGDMWNVVGSTIRPYGLTVDETALWLRIPEVEEFNRTRAKIFLSSEPATVLHFLGLPITGCWDAPFNSLEDMYEYVTHCRMLWVRPLEQTDPMSDDHAPSENKDISQNSDHKKLKSNDRKRMSKRPAFREWIDDFIPRCRAQGRFAEQKTTREEVTKEALNRFGVADTFYSRQREMLLERQKETIWNKLIKGTIPEAASSDPSAVLFRGCQVKALKRIILEGDDSYGILPGELKNEAGYFDLERVAEFIDKHKYDVGVAAVKKQNARYAEVMREREARTKK